ncbi:AP2 domain transcription factor AP2XII-4 [Toxoplasma gondii ARI]|uniref:AP2 domain transcription factor AP2XII-4 n=1 Tax=Toxoplasma gondii ARI TaxID=1074872 RepID=A0A139YA85_TOXGO|nr:AP2 domain transcription factor AP2XII-4 [Toxoplasma gondii ARI]
MAFRLEKIGQAREGKKFETKNEISSAAALPRAAPGPLWTGLLCQVSFCRPFSVTHCTRSVKERFDCLRGACPGKKVLRYRCEWWCWCLLTKSRRRLGFLSRRGTNLRFFSRFGLEGCRPWAEGLRFLVSTGRVSFVALSGARRSGRFSLLSPSLFFRTRAGRRGQLKACLRDSEDADARRPTTGPAMPVMFWLCSLTTRANNLITSPRLGSPQFYKSLSNQLSANTTLLRSDTAPMHDTYIHDTYIYHTHMHIYMYICMYSSWQRCTER